MLINFIHSDPHMDEINSRQEIKELANFIFNNRNLAFEAAKIIRGGDNKKDMIS